MMKNRDLILPTALLLAACSETPIDEQGAAAIAELEQQIQEDAQSLEEAAAEAVRTLEEEIDAEMAEDGITAPERPES
ncbi:hypothetical protein [Parasphingorhabdus sp.]|uniref:hypothetical protein n=1 Tax=Parasphingorhabdus sp. TaxID=2709688 RepID=UPI0032666464